MIIDNIYIPHRPELHPKSWTRKPAKGGAVFYVSCTLTEKRVNLYKLHGAEGLLSRNQVGRQKDFESEFRLKVLQYKREHPLSCTQTAITGLRCEYKLAALLLLVSFYNSSWDLGAIYRKGTTNTGVIYFIIRPKIVL